MTPTPTDIARLKELAGKATAREEAAQAAFWDAIGTMGPEGILALIERITELELQLQEARGKAIEEVAHKIEFSAEQENAPGSVGRAILRAVVKYVRALNPKDTPDEGACLPKGQEPHDKAD